jgi:TonB family protein
MTQRTDFQALETDHPIGGVSNGAAPASNTRSKRAVRIAVSLPIEIRDQFGGKDQTRTQFVLLRGCVLTTPLAVHVGNKLSLQNLKSGRVAECHVIAVEPGLNGAHQVEVEFTGVQAEFWPVQFPAEESRHSVAAPAPHAPVSDSKPRAKSVSDKDLLVLADSAAQDFSIGRIHSPERIATKIATADSVAQFRAANRAAHRREQRKKAIYSALFFAALSGAAVGARYWFTHRPQLLEATPAPELRSMAQKIARAIPAKTANATQASTIASGTLPESNAASDNQAPAPAIVSEPTITPAANPQSAAGIGQSAIAQAEQTSVDTTQSGAVSVRHGSTAAAMRKSKADEPSEEPVALPLHVAESASLTKPDALKDVVVDVPAQTAVLAAQVPKRAVPARLIHSVPAQYPAMARQLRVEGEVLLDVNVDGTGAVSSVKAVSGPPLLRSAAMDCVKHWKYEPATLGDKPIASTEVVKVDFHLR